MGSGALSANQASKKLNTKSSTEAEFVGASDYLPNTVWVKMFLEAQGYKNKECILEQDNDSAIKLEKNGLSRDTYNIRYFWIKDRTEAEGITVRHCPKLHMLADFLTKPLQGQLFKSFRDVILGYRHVDTLNSLVVPTPAQERVGFLRTGDDKTATTRNLGLEFQAEPRAVM